jgi:hypothetical protein
MLPLYLLQNVLVSTKFIRNPFNQSSPNNKSYDGYVGDAA